MRLTIASVLVSDFGFRDAASNGARLELAASIAASPEVDRCRLVVVPAGFLSAGSEPTAKARAGELAACFRDRAVVGGIDVLPAAKVDGKRGAQAVRAGTLPFFVFVADRGHIRFWARQRSTTSENSALVPREAPRLDPQDPRVVRLRGHDIAILACGELFNPTIREAVARARPSLVAHVSHLGLGRTFPRTYPWLVETTRGWIVNAQHARSSNATPTMWAAWPGAKALFAEAHRTFHLHGHAGRAGVLWADLRRWSGPA